MVLVSGYSENWYNIFGVYEKWSFLQEMSGSRPILATQTLQK